ncbi:MULTISPECIES: helix-turn-helix domain-containing protein [unclassified Lentilitoribacter]|uniref:helix-turn-helix domain-containing protein n=1 Tax=unclassified Lentilitoribacter TaxID=2647570 RepID=UPI0013A6B28E|nr:helix-turn-helix transcriptional regulator [Lentilitoribacter sp. Alg239-R112]
MRRRIQAQRQKLDVNVVELSKTCGVPVGHIVDFENGLRDLGVDKIQKLSAALGMPIAITMKDVISQNTDKAGDTTYDELRLQGLELNRAFVDVKDVTLRRDIVLLVHAISKQEKHMSEDEIKHARLKLEQLVAALRQSTKNG